MDMLSWLWLIATVVFLLIEVATVGLVSIWFLFGALTAFILARLSLPFGLQLTAFAVVSAVLLIFTRKVLVDKLHIGSRLKTNVESLIGTEGVVTADIGKFSTGLVKAHGQVWTAVSDKGEIIGEGDTVVIIRIEGVKLVVAPK